MGVVAKSQWQIRLVFSSSISDRVIMVPVIRKFEMQYRSFQPTLKVIYPLAQGDKPENAAGQEKYVLWGHLTVQ
jgi:hypothetical protein